MTEEEKQELEALRQEKRQRTQQARALVCRLAGRSGRCGYRSADRDVLCSLSVRPGGRCAATSSSATAYPGGICSQPGRKRYSENSINHMERFPVFERRGAFFYAHSQPFPESGDHAKGRCDSRAGKENADLPDQHGEKDLEFAVQKY